MFIRLSEPISRGTVTGQRTSTTRSRASCPTSRTSEHSRAGARGCDVRMFGCLPLDGPHREGGLLAGLRTFCAPNFGDPAPAASPILRVIVAHRRDARAGRCGCWSTRSWSITYFILCSSSRDCLKTLRSSFNSARASPRVLAVLQRIFIAWRSAGTGGIRRRLFPRTAGDLQGLPERVLAPQRGLDNIGPVLRR